MSQTILDAATKGPMQAEGVRGAQRFTNDAASIAAVAPSDTTDLPGGPTLGLWCTVGGNVALVCENDPNNTGTIIPVAANVRLPFRVRRVLATGTTATVVALY